MKSRKFLIKTKGREYWRGQPDVFDDGGLLREKYMSIEADNLAFLAAHDFDADVCEKMIDSLAHGAREDMYYIISTRGKKRRMQATYL